MKTKGFVKHFLLFQFIASAPLAMLAVYKFEWERYRTAVLNSYAFSSAMVLLYLYPFLWPVSLSKYALAERIEEATMNWILWLSVFTELTFQIPHNLCVGYFHQHLGRPLEWPFFAYGLSDSRWSKYNNGEGLDAYVWAINVNDALFGYIVFLCWMFKRRIDGNVTASRTQRIGAQVIFCLAVVFRDATIFRETVEYLWDMHRTNYPYSLPPTYTHSPQYPLDDSLRLSLRPHAIVCLWLVNVIWLIAPLVSVWWAYKHIMACSVGDPAHATGIADHSVGKKDK